MARSHARKRRTADATSGDEDLIARAEAAIATLSSHFAGWMDEECRRLEGTCQRVQANRSDEDALDQLFRATHDIKGEASTFGFPPVERIAASLCRLISDAPHRAQIPFDLIQRHVAAMRHALRLHREGEELAGELERAAIAFLRDAGSLKAYPEVKAPPLAPGE